MKKLFILVLMLLVMGSTALGRVEYRTVEDSITSDQATVYSPTVDMREFSQLYLWFHCSQADTSKSDSITVTFQSFTQVNELWTDIMAFAEKADADTFTLFKFFYFDSLGETTYPIDNGTRLKIAFSDTNTAEESDSAKFLPIVDTLVNGWTVSTGSDHFALIDETADADSSDYVYVTAYGDVDSLELFGVTDHYYRETQIDSVVLKFAGEWVTDTAWLSWCMCVSDTDRCEWAQDTATGTLLTDSALTSYSYTLTTMPDYGTAWQNEYLDSLVFGFFPSAINSGGQINIYYAYVTVYTEEGLLSPTFKYRVRYKFIE